MPNIKFTHPYTKLKDVDGSVVSTSQLLQIVMVDLDNCSDELIAYDTDNGKYELQRNLYMMLIFKKPSVNLFTTLRRYTPDKHTYYKKLVGQNFDIVIQK